MKLLVTTITRSPKGNPIPASKEIVGEQIRVGRGAECEFRLADPRVPIQAKLISLGGGGAQIFDFTAPSRGGSSETTRMERPSPLKHGAVMEIGPYRLEVVAAPDGYDLSVTVELTHPLPESTKTAGKAILQQAGNLPISRRMISWLIFIPLFLWFLVFPVMNSISADAGSQVVGSSAKSGVNVALDGAAKVLRPVSSKASDSAWNPGTLSRSHQNLTEDCRACHSEPFKMVQDQDCLVCHKNAAPHVDKKLGSVPSLDAIRCAECHIDHKGALALKEQNAHYYSKECSSCHADVKAAMPKTLTGNVKDFASEHPDFRVSVATGPRKTDLRRVRLDDKANLRSLTNLKFPHDVHLASEGIDSPNGVVKMECGHCHQVDATGLKFKPITMKAHCQSCHELKFEPDFSSRQVPHGNVEDVLTTLNEFYSAAGFLGTPLDVPRPAQVDRLPPGKTAPVAQRVLTKAQAQDRANKAAKQLFEKSACFMCHQVKAAEPVDQQLNWTIEPIRETHVWMTKSLFPHDKHTMAECSDCHKASASKNAQDVLMPSIDTCRTCHAGATPEPKKIVSNCNMCHGFHVTDHTMPPNNPEPSVVHKAIVSKPIIQNQSVSPRKEIGQ